MTDTNPAPKTVAQMLGEITWLMTQSPIHKQLFIGDLEWFAMPAILVEQFRIFYGPNSPAAVALWAMVSEDTEERLKLVRTSFAPTNGKAGIGRGSLSWSPPLALRTKSSPTSPRPSSAASRLASIRRRRTANVW